jgi:hydrogenase nickel incorporation protein HypA/HybF
MHEMGIAFELIDSLKSICKENHLSKISTVTMQLGEASLVVPRYLQECFSAAVDGTSFEGVKLKFETIEAKGRCSKCGTVFGISASGRKCPTCASEEWDLIDGSQITIKEVKAASPTNKKHR